jgi:LacI family transcriptional regulator
MLSHLERQIGFDEALHEYDPREVEVQIIDEPGEPTAAGLRAVQKALVSYRFSAVVAINDLVALGAFRGLQAAGLRIPGDVSVVGFDNTYLCEFLHPPLTTVATPRKGLADRVIAMLLGFVEKEDVAKEISLSAELFVRESTAAPPRGN